MRKMVFMMSELALADPVPFTLANLTTKSLTRSGALTELGMDVLIGRRRYGKGGFLHVPRRRRAALGAQTAVHAHVLVLEHDAPGLRQGRGDEQGLLWILRGRLETAAQLRFAAVRCDGQAVDRADVDAGIALDAQLRAEHRLHVTVETALHLELRLPGREAELDLDVDALEALGERDMRHEPTLGAVVLVLVRPLVHAHLAALQGEAARLALRDRLAPAELVDRDRSLMAMLDRPDDVLRAEGRIAAEEHLRARRLKGDRIDLRQVEAIELDADVALDPGEGILLSDCENDIVARIELLAHDPRRFDLPVLERIFEMLEHHALERTALDHEAPGGTIDDDLDVLLLSVLELPIGGFEELARLSSHHLHVPRAEPQGRAAAIHRRIAHADDEHALADAVDVLERH